ncbi:MAG: orotate phosphoribosyltransferase [Candidatus Moraniibacteriota bacterium]|jgi:orotate phosphoribosyltransferase
MENQLTELGKMLLERSYRKGEFTLTSGKTSDFYINGKQTFLEARGAVLIGQCFLRMIQESGLNISAVAGVPVGATPLVDAISVLSSLDETATDLAQIIVRKKTNDHGAGNQIERPQSVKDGDMVALVDDVITTAGTLIRAIEALEKSGLVVGIVILIVDREEGGKEVLAKAGYDNVHAIFTKSELLAMK